MSYDGWKTTDPADEELGSCPQSDEPEGWEPSDEHVQELSWDRYYRTHAVEEDEELPF